MHAVQHSVLETEFLRHVTKPPSCCSDLSTSEPCGLDAGSQPVHFRALRPRNEPTALQHRLLPPPLGCAAAPLLPRPPADPHARAPASSPLAAPGRRHPSPWRQLQLRPPPRCAYGRPPPLLLPFPLRAAARWRLRAPCCRRPDLQSAWSWTRAAAAAPQQRGRPPPLQLPGRPPQPALRGPPPPSHALLSAASRWLHRQLSALYRCRALCQPRRPRQPAWLRLRQRLCTQRPAAWRRRPCCGPQLQHRAPRTAVQIEGTPSANRHTSHLCNRGLQQHLRRVVIKQGRPQPVHVYTRIADRKRIGW